MIGFNITNYEIYAQDTEWLKPEMISSLENSSWFPDITIDPFGTIHVIWCYTTSMGNLDQEAVMYSKNINGVWEKPNDIIGPSQDIIRNAITADLSGNLHLFFGGSTYGVLEGRYTRASVQGAWSAANWINSKIINSGVTYTGEITVDSKGNLHIIFDDSVQIQSSEQISLADIYYRSSSNSGKTWSDILELESSPSTGSARPHLKIDGADVLHVTWDEGWDRLSGVVSSEFYSVYINSQDGGNTWSSPLIVDYPDSRVVELTVGSNGEGQIVLLWRSTEQNDFYWRRSTNGGKTWTNPETIPGIYARRWGNPFDYYDSVTDSNGDIHFFIIGRESPDEQATIGVYELVWDGEKWLPPTPVYSQENFYPFYAKAEIYEGNRIHLVWYTMEGSEFAETQRLVWYSSRQLNTTRQPIEPWPTFTAVPTRTPLPTPILPPTSTPFQITNDSPTNQTLSHLNTVATSENDDLAIIFLALFPVILIIMIIVALQVRRR